MFATMLNILSVLIGLFALLLMVPAFLPFLGMANWLLVPIALFGAVLGVLSTRNSGRNLCLLVAAFGAFRLFLGGGIF